MRSDFVRFLVDGEEQFFLQREELFFARVLVELQLGLVDRPALLRILHHAEERFVARLAELHLEQSEAARTLVSFFVPLLEKLLRLAREPVAEHGLLAHELLDERLPLVVLMGRDRGRSADDQRRARFVDQDGIHFVDDREMVAALDLLLARRGHAVVAQIIETELRVRPVGDVHRVLLAANVRRLIVLNAADGQTEKVVELRPSTPRRGGRGNRSPSRDARRGR